MDYHGKINADFHGLGKYDNAAIKFAYGQIIETFTDTSVQGSRDLKQWRYLNDYKKLPQYIGSVEQMRAREDVIFDWTQPNLTAEQVAQITEKEVPYLYCSDEYANLTPTCKRFDFGANQREVMEAKRIGYKNYFVFSNYLRNRLVLNWAAIDRGYTTFREAVMTYQYWYLYRARDASFADTDLYKDMVQAFVDGFNLMTEVLAMPEPGYYTPCQYGTDTPGDLTDDKTVFIPAYYLYYSSAVQAGGEGYVAFNEGETCADPYENEDILLTLGDSQPLFLGFSDDYVAWTFTYLGTYWDKQAALMELADPFAMFFRTNGTEDFRSFSVSPFRVFDLEILGLMNGLLRYDLPSLGSFVDVNNLDADGRPLDGLAPRLLIDPNQALPDVALPGQTASTGAVVYPALARNLMRLGVVYGTALLTSPLDDSLDFAKHTRVAMKGGVDDISAFDDIDNALILAECTLPDSGQTYRALDTDDGYGIGYDMVEKCSNLVGQLTQTRDDLVQAVIDRDTAEDDLEDAEAALAANSDPGQEATLQAAVDDAEDAYDSAYNAWWRLEVRKDNVEFDLSLAQQALQYTRLVHLVYEHGDEL